MKVMVIKMKKLEANIFKRDFHSLNRVLYYDALLTHIQTDEIISKGFRMKEGKIIMIN